MVFYVDAKASPCLSALPSLDSLDVTHCIGFQQLPGAPLQTASEEHQQVSAHFWCPFTQCQLQPSLAAHLKGLTYAQTHRTFLSPVVHAHFGTLTSLNAASDDAGQIISDTAIAEGGPSKGSASAQMQSEVAKTRNTEQGDAPTDSNTSRSGAAQRISEAAKAEGGATKGSASAKMQSEFAKQRNAAHGIGRSRNKSAAGQAISDVAKAEGGTTQGSTSAQMQSEISKAQNAGSGQGGASESVDPTTRSQMNREANLIDAEQELVPKMQNDPEHVTKEDASLLRSRETRAHGVTEKGGVAATAQHMAAENEKQGTI